MTASTAPLRLLWLVAILGIVYGSLYPFRFEAAGLGEAQIAALMGSWAAPTSRGDALGNFVLFVPAGFLGAVAFARRTRAQWPVVLLIGLGVLAVGLQVLQLGVPGRNPSLFDALLNVTGAGVGVGLALTLGRPLAVRAARRRMVVAPLLVALAWVTHVLLPLVPSLDLQALKSSLKPLMYAPTIEIEVLVLGVIGWVTAGQLVRAGSDGRAGIVALTALIGATLAAQLVIVNNVLSASEVAAAALALLALALAGSETRPVLLAGLAVAALALDGLWPFELRADVAAFGWVPFQGFLEGSMFRNVAALTFKAFFYGSLVWWVRAAGAGGATAVLCAMATAAAIELAQTRFAWHGPEITDVVLAAFAGFALLAIDRVRPSAPPLPGVIGGARLSSG